MAKRLILTLLLLVTFYSGNGQVFLKVSNLNTSSSEVYVAVFSKPESFPHTKDFYLRKIVKTNGAENVVVNLGKLPEGLYAFGVFQDLNGNKVLDKSFIGYPKEPWGLSRNFKPRFAAPTFDDVSVQIKGDKSQFQISLQ